MPNQYVNKVVQSDGTTLIDITDTTATASDVASGKYFYSAAGARTLGTGTGGGNYVLTYDEDSSVGIAVVGTAKTGTPNYIPSGQIDYTTGTVSVSVAPTLNYSYSNYILSITGVSASASTNRQVVTGINGFIGNGVHFIIEQEESE